MLTQEREQPPVDIQYEMNFDHVTPQCRFSKSPQYWVYYHRLGARVRGWPSQGGLYELDIPSRVEPEFLQLDLFNNMLRPSPSDPEWQAKENAHCDRMRRLGATWWKNDHEEDYDELFGHYEKKWEKKYTRIGWPTGGGVWAWQTTQMEAAKQGGGKLLSARTMDERCKLIEMLGGVFFADPKDCPYLDLHDG
ncbi:hypothetical protein N7495_008395 [Penicillium taxi]|uniref:uncharacterized protein n=1 Tax=Penicillium taxi TaxID=168475 RepID=UPI002545A067|nr:uncharacterized protein N7495_008395 [Penicillium taxi]KAJ5888354.1 hypothetical protein N7495_008395 [Penicillium taxi]